MQVASLRPERILLPLRPLIPLHMVKLKGALGEDQMAKLTGVLDPIVANRRAITVVSAIIDVAVVLGLLKFAQGFFSGGGDSS